jgi:SsrA-binding protein
VWLPWLAARYLLAVTGRRNDAQKFIAQNRAAAFHYFISERHEAGIVLRGSEVKSLRDGRVELKDAYASVERGEVWLRQMHIASFFAARAFPHAERGVRKLLLHTKEIRSLERCVDREGFTLLPLDLYFKNGFVKVTLGLARGKKIHDKRATIAERTEAREALELVRAHQRSTT